MKQSGFTLIEIMVVIVIMGSLFGLTALGVSRANDFFITSTADIMLIDALSSASRRARAGLQGQSWGVYLPYDEGTRRTNELILFAGDDYASRDQQYDTTYAFPAGVAFTDVQLSGSGGSSGDDHEVVFDAFSGATDEYGVITIELNNDSREIHVAPEGISTREE